MQKLVIFPLAFEIAIFPFCPRVGCACKLSVDGARYALNSPFSLIKAATVRKNGERKKGRAAADQRHTERKRGANKTF
jgi:hypothetical protein